MPSVFIPPVDQSLARSWQLAMPILAAGLAGLVAWEAFAHLVAPLWLGYALAPADLIEMTLGFGGWPAQLLHLATGLVFYPAGYVLVMLPVLRRLPAGLPARLSWPVSGIALGVATWVFALFVMAHLVGGLPPFLEFDAVAWASLVGHVLMGLAIALVVAAYARIHG